MQMREKYPKGYKRVHQDWMVSVRTLTTALRPIQRAVPWKISSDNVHVGRAKVYAFRGRYRHYFLRVTPESGIECHPANLVVDPDLTLKLFVEEVSTLSVNPLPLTADRGT